MLSNFSIIAQVIIEMLLFKDCIISHYNHPERGDYNTEAIIFQNGHRAIFVMFLNKKQIK